MNTTIEITKAHLIRKEDSSIRKKFEFSVLGFILGCFYFFLSFVLIHQSWLGNPFGSSLSILVILYLSACTWALSYIIKDLDRFNSEVETLGYTIFIGLTVVLYFAAPMVFIWLKFFDTKDEKNRKKRLRNKTRFEFSVAGFILGCFFFFLSFISLHRAWMGSPFESPLSILVTIYLGVCTWSLSYILNELEESINSFTEKPFGRVILTLVHLILYFVSPMVFIWMKFSEER